MLMMFSRDGRLMLKMLLPLCRLMPMMLAPWPADADDAVARLDADDAHPVAG